MKFIRKADGKVYDNIADAVIDYKCPGPCSDCILTGSVLLSNGQYGHRCHVDYAERHPVSVANLIGLQVIRDNEPENTSARYIALIKASAIRDVEIAKTPDADLLDEDSWYPMKDARIYIGMFSGETAREAAANYALTDPNNIELIKI